MCRKRSADYHLCEKIQETAGEKEVVQVYVQALQGKLGRPARELKAFAKTKELAPGEKQKMTLHIPVKNLASYDDSGVAGHKSCYVSERQVLTYSMWVIVCGIRKSQMWMEKEHIS